MSDITTETDRDDDDDVIVTGAKQIAREIFGGRVSARQVYRMAEPGRGWPIFRDRRQLHAREKPMRREVARREREAAQQRAHEPTT